MTGGAFFASAGDAEEYELDEYGGSSERHAVQWVGTPGVKGPKFAKLPLLTVGMLGIQVSSMRPLRSGSYEHNFVSLPMIMSP